MDVEQAMRQKAEYQASQDLLNLQKIAERRLVKIGANNGEVQHIIKNDKGEELILPGRRQFNFQSIARQLEIVNKRITALKNKEEIDKAIAAAEAEKQLLLDMKAVLEA